MAPEVNSCIIRRMTCYTEVHCPKCDSKKIKKAGFNTCGVQRYFCRNVSCDVMLSYRYKVYNDGVIEQAIEMTINSSGMRDTARVLGISRNTISKALKKRRNHC